MTSEPAAERSRQLEFAERIALRQLESRARSESELRRALSRRNVPEDIAEEVLGKLKEYRYVDDRAFAEALVASRVQHSARGRARIRQELRTKGVEREVAERAMADLDPEEEWAAAREFAQKKARAMRGLEFHVALRRLSGALARRGFGADIVSSVSRETLGDAELGE